MRNVDDYLNNNNDNDNYPLKINQKEIKPDFTNYLNLGNSKEFKNLCKIVINKK